MSITNDASKPSQRTDSKKKSHDPGQKNVGWLLIFAKYGGFGGLILFVFLTLFSMFGNLTPLFSKLNADQTYRIIVIFMLLVFAFSVSGLLSWVLIKKWESDSQKAQVGIFVLTVLVVCGSGAWASARVIKRNIEKSLDATRLPLKNQEFLEDSKWEMALRLTEFANYLGSTSFSKSQTFDASGDVIFAPSTKKPLKCRARLSGTWSYGKDVHLLIIKDFYYEYATADFIPDDEKAKQQIDPCAKEYKKLFLSPRSPGSCKFIDDKKCRGDKMTLDLITK